MRPLLAVSALAVLLTLTACGGDPPREDPYAAGFTYMSGVLAELDPTSYRYAEELEIAVDACTSVGRRANATGEYGPGAGTDMIRGCSDALANHR